jgi:hypothetical protein
MNVETQVRFTDQCIPWKATNCVENLIFQVLQSQKVGVCCKLPGWAGYVIIELTSALWRVNLMLALDHLLSVMK